MLIQMWWVHRESTSVSFDAEAVEEDVYIDELDTLAGHGIRDLIVGPDGPLYDGIKSIERANLSPFFKIMNLVIANNIDSY